MFIKYLCKPILLQIFAAVKASLVAIYTIIVKNIAKGIAKYILLK